MRAGGPAGQPFGAEPELPRTSARGAPAPEPVPRQSLVLRVWGGLRRSGRWLRVVRGTRACALGGRLHRPDVPGGEADTQSSRVCRGRCSRVADRGGAPAPPAPG